MHIGPATSEEWFAAFELALAHGDSASGTRALNALSLLAAGEIDPEGIFVARTDTGLCGVQVCIPLRGASGLFWLPRTKPFDPNLETDLARRALAWLKARGTKIAQAILNTGEDGTALLVAGFRHVTQLDYLEHTLHDIKPVPHRLKVVPFSVKIEDHFRATLLQTYEGTSDFPELNNRRTMDEILAGHQAQGPFDPQRWWLAFADDEPVAVSLVSKIADLNAWDLSYLGVVPKQRGRGYAHELATRVLLATEAERLIVAVDRRNVPARRLYAALGFAFVDSREVYLYFFE